MTASVRRKKESFTINLEKKACKEVLTLKRPGNTKNGVRFSKNPGGGPVKNLADTRATRTSLAIFLASVKTGAVSGPARPPRGEI